ncbi:chromosomal replication initiator protein DnaA [Thiorhodospira sibirica]|uniref:chromosomal replication initiator protein DnaA n=1 Tax=Thiorhodospira sibirica TaxID=154347 RepID=UPI00022C044F|nr:chromosomal replication initiator protein DnaA [Thiorhodospira sibirica]
MPGNSLWQQCIARLERELSDQQLNTWIRPLHAIDEEDTVRLLAPNRFVLDWVRKHFFARIETLINECADGRTLRVQLEVGSQRAGAGKNGAERTTPLKKANGKRHSITQLSTPASQFTNNLNPNYTFDNFVEGKSNQLARAASQQVADAHGKAYNPMFIYGGVGLGKTHLMHAIGNDILQRNTTARVVYLHSERFVADMIKALQHNLMNDFKRYYRSADALLIDDIQFFAGKERSQEEFFHTFNALMEGHHQVIIACDRFPNEVNGLEERLKSRFGWGLTVAITPPELDTRIAILQNKAQQAGLKLPNEVAYFMAKRIRANIRELEGALRRILASAQFSGKPVDLAFAKEALRDMLSAQEHLVSIENIQKIVSDYYKVSIADMVSSKRTRAISRPRQMCMALAKELTTNSLPQIGRSFGGRDHTTVLYACRKVNELRKADQEVDEAFNTLLQRLSG